MQNRSRGAHHTSYVIRHTSPERGFTLVELLVVTAIVVLISGVVLANNTKFGGVVRLQNLAYDLALSVRQAQVYGISVKRYGVGEASSYSAGYGVHFNMANPTQYVLFGDIDGSGLYSQDEIVPPSPFTIRSGYRIQDLCAAPLSDQVPVCGYQQLDIVFKRPEPEAWISAGNADAIASCRADFNNCKSSAVIILSSPQGDTMRVLVEANGQIAVKK